MFDILLVLWANFLFVSKINIVVSKQQSPQCLKYNNEHNDMAFWEGVGGIMLRALLNIRLIFDDVSLHRVNLILCTF